jgi:hypothetical protein
MHGGRTLPPGSWITVMPAMADKLVARGIASLPADWGVSAEKHVLMVSQQCDIRVCKEAFALRQNGWRVDLLGSRIPQIPGSFDMIRIEREADWPEVIAASGARIIHLHNEPDYLMYACDAGANGRPIVYDVHDMEFHRFGYVTDDESFAFDRADAIIHTSAQYAKVAHRKHGRATKPEGIVHSCMPKAWKPKWDKKAPRDGVVYQGASRPHAGPNDRFREHTEVVGAFTSFGVRFDMLTDGPAAAAYPNARLMVPYMAMLTQLTRYRWGFLGNDIPTAKWGVAMPNKYFEYLACGVPILSCCAPAVEAYAKGRADIYESSMPALLKRVTDPRLDWYEYSDQIKNWWMDYEIDELIKVYDAVIGTWKCPYCGEGKKNEQGLTGHVRTKHPEVWEEFKAGRSQ